MAKTGEIDHLVATPCRVWVIETKHRRVPPMKFLEVLRRLAFNAQAVCERTASGTPVQACLVLTAGSIRKKEYSCDGKEIVVHDQESLVHALRKEREAEVSIDSEISQKIWRMGHENQQRAT